MWKRFFNVEVAQGLIEYSLLIAIVSLAAVTIIMALMSPNLSKTYQKSTDHLNQVGTK